MFSVYLECELKQDSYDRWRWKFNLKESVEKTYLERSKEQERYRLTHLEVSKKEPRHY